RFLKRATGRVANGRMDDARVDPAVLETRDRRLGSGQAPRRATTEEDPSTASRCEETCAGRRPCVVATLDVSNPRKPRRIADGDPSDLRRSEGEPGDERAIDVDVAREACRKSGQRGVEVEAEVRAARVRVAPVVSPARLLRYVLAARAKDEAV